MATHSSSKSIPVNGVHPRMSPHVAVPSVAVHPAPGIPAPLPLRASSGNIAVVARPPKKVDPDEELENILFQNDDVEARDDEEVQKEELVTLGTTPSPAPLPGDFPFSPPARGGNPMILNSPFQRESALDSSPPGAGPGAKASPISPREAFRRRRARSLSCPEKDPNLLISEA